MAEVAEIKLPGRPSQIRFIRPAQMEIFAKLVCFPPLGQLTVIERGQREVRARKNRKVSLAKPVLD